MHVSLASLERSSFLRSVFATLDAILVFILASYEKDAAYNMMHALKIRTYCIRCNRLFIVLSRQLGKKSMQPDALDLDKKESEIEWRRDLCGGDDVYRLSGPTLIF